MPAATRDRLVEAGEQLFCTQGYAATGVKQILTEAGATFASLYHFFPEGKSELAAAAIRSSGARYGDLLDVFFGDVVKEDLPQAMRACYAAAAQTLVETDYADACPIATVALEIASTNEPLREATADVFTGWIERGTARFAAVGLPEPTARELTIALVSQLEGAFVLARALRSTEPLLVAGEVMAQRAAAL
jgi:AcrR family transcriptional regulator